MDRSNPTRRERLIAILIVLACDAIGLCMLALGLYLYQQKDTFLATAQPAEGIIVGFEQLKDADDSSDRGKPVPVVRFRTAGGEEAQFRENTFILWKDYALRQPVQVLYDPADPQSAQIDSFWHIWFGVTLCGTMGLLFTTVPMLTLLRVIVGKSATPLPERRRRIELPRIDPQ